MQLTTEMSCPKNTGVSFLPGAFQHLKTVLKARAHCYEIDIQIINNGKYDINSFRRAHIKFQ